MRLTEFKRSVQDKKKNNYKLKTQAQSTDMLLAISFHNFTYIAIYMYIQLCHSFGERKNKTMLIW